MRSYVIHRQSDNTFLSLLSVHLVHSWQRLSSDIFALLFFFLLFMVDFAKGCLFSSLMKIEKTIYSLCLVTFSDDELFGEK